MPTCRTGLLTHSSFAGGSYQRRVKASTGTVLDESWPPVELGGGLDPVRIVGEIAAPLCQGLIEIGQGVEIAVGQRLVDHGPEMLGRLEFRGIGRQELQADAVGNLQFLGALGPPRQPRPRCTARPKE